MLSGDIKRKYFSKMDQELVINPEKSDQNLISWFLFDLSVEYRLHIRKKTKRGASFVNIIFNY